MPEPIKVKLGQGNSMCARCVRKRQTIHQEGDWYDVHTLGLSFHVCEEHLNKALRKLVHSR